MAFDGFTAGHVRALAALDDAREQSMQGDGRPLAQFIGELRNHMFCEEQFLFPILENALGIGLRLTRDLRAEHRLLRGLLLRAEQADEPERRARVLTDLRALASAHFDREERELFPIGERTLPSAAVTELERVLARMW